MKATCRLLVLTATISAALSATATAQATEGPLPVIVQVQVAATQQHASASVRPWISKYRAPHLRAGSNSPEMERLGIEGSRVRVVARLEVDVGTEE